MSITPFDGGGKLPRYFSKAEIAVSLGLTVRRLDALIASEQFPPPDMTLSRTPRWREDTLRDWEDDRRNGG